MTTWRMSFRVGNHGREMWEDCYKLGVAAIAYRPLVTTNLQKHPRGEPIELWNQLAPAQKASLRRVAYEMKAGDVIFVKKGPKIVGRGVVQGAYEFDSRKRLVDNEGFSWAHQVPVEWESDFPEIDILLGAEQLCVKKLSADNIRTLKKAAKGVRESIRQTEAMEGETYRKEAIFRRRNRTLIQAIKANSDYRCEVCGFSFREAYGAIGQEYIIAHHLRLISSGVAKTTPDDVALLCANCHSMVHTKNPPIPIENLRKTMGVIRPARAYGRTRP
jgi:hypothetical protein